MIKKLFFLSLSVLFFASCNKTTVNSGHCTYTPSTLKADTAEVTYLKNYLAANSIVAVQDTSGYFYSVGTIGSGASVNICSSVIVQYTGWLLLTGFKFDENTAGAIFQVGGVIDAWQKVLPTMMPGGTITIYVPPSLAYGATVTATIPANSYLKFYIKLVAVE